jgi:hypothetical protein
LNTLPDCWPRTAHILGLQLTGALGCGALGEIA